MFISVVIPVFNAEDYLKDTVESVLSQSFRDFEVILVDDCSTDKSGGLCDILAAYDSRITSVRLSENRGVSNARDVGAANAAGEYLFFFDADDLIEKDAFRTIFDEMGDNRPDAVIFGVTEDYFDRDSSLKTSFVANFGKTVYLNQSKFRKEIINLERRTLFGYACNKFYNLAYFRKLNIRYPVAELNEDFLFNVEFFRDADSVLVLNNAFYHYNKRFDGSRTGRFVADYYPLHLNRIELLIELYESWNLLSFEIAEIIAGIYLRYTLSYLQRNCDRAAGLNHAKRRKLLKDIYNSHFYKKLINHVNAESFYTRAAAFFLKHRLTPMTLTLARIIYIVKERLPFLFLKLKQNR